MKHLITLTLCISVITVSAQSDYYWIGDAGDWSDLTHWATSSGGATLHTELPGSDDNVYFDANSFSLIEQVVALNVDAICKDMDWTDVTNSPSFISLGNSNQNSLSVHGSLVFSDQMGKNLDGINLLSSETGNIITTGETSLGSTSSLRFEGSGEWSLTDSTSIGWFRVQGSSTLNTNDNPVFTNFFMEGKSFGTLNAGSSKFYLDLGFNIVNSSFTFNAGSSTLIIKEGNRFKGFNSSYNEVIILSGGELFIEDNNSFNILTAEPGSSLIFEEGTTQTVNTLNIDGGKTNPIVLNSNVPGVQANIVKTSGTVNGDFLVLQDINASGGATFNAFNSVDNGNNSGWNVTTYTGQDYYWINGSGSWSDVSHWATTSGGSTLHTELPGILDAVFFDGNSGSDDTQVTTTSADVTGDLTFSNLAPGFTILGNSQELGVFGSLALSENLEIITNIKMQSGAVESVTGSTPDRITTITFDGTGTWNMTDSLSAESIFHNKGILNTNDFPLNATRQFWIQPSGPSNRSDLIEFHGGTSDIYVKDFSTDQFWIFEQNISPNEVDFSNTTLHMTNSTSRSVIGGGLVFNNLIVGSGLTQAFGSQNGGLQLNKITILPGAEFEMSEGEENKITFNSLTASGTVNDPIRIESFTAGEQAFFESISGTDFTGEYLEILDMNASGATFTANQSVDLGNNTGWTITSSKQNQTISFDEIPDKIFGDPDFELSGSATSGLEITFSTSSTNIDLNGSTVSILRPGTATITAQQSGNVDFNEAAEVSRTFVINRAAQTITFESIPNKTPGDEPFEVVATTSSDLAVVFSVVTGPITLDGSTVTITGSGEATVRATQPGDVNYEPATFVDQTFQIEEIVGLDSETEQVFSVYPNPSETTFNLTIDTHEVKEIWAISPKGERLEVSISEHSNAQLGAEFAPGIWLLQIVTNKGVQYKKLLKR